MHSIVIKVVLLITFLKIVVLLDNNYFLIVLMKLWIKKCKQFKRQINKRKYILKKALNKLWKKKST